MEPITAQRIAATTYAAGVRTVVEDGTSYLVAPVVAVVDGVLNGELVRSSVLARNLDEWQGTPVTVHHPPKHLQASITKTHEWVRNNKIGTMRDVHVSNGRLKGGLWLPKNQQGEAQTILSRIEAGTVYEVSVGFLSIMTSDSGVAKGKRFVEVTQDAAPNHIALLPDEEGACSKVDGCGFPRAASAASRVKYEGSELDAWSLVDHTLRAYVQAASKATGIEVDADSDVADLPAEIKTWIASKTILGDASAKTEAELLRAPVVNPATNRLNRSAVAAVFGHRVESMSISAESKQQARAEAASLLTTEFGVPITAETAQEKSMADKAKTKVNGKRLGASLTAILNERSKNATERNELMQRLATAADIDVKRVKAIAAGSEDFTEDDVIKTFADVLKVSPGLLYVAAMEDVGEFMEGLAPQDNTAPESGSSFFATAMQAFKEWTGIATNNGGKAMKRCELESRIKAKVEKFTEADDKALEALPDGALKTFAKGIGVDVEGFEPKADAPKAEPKAKESEPKAKAEDDNKPLTLADLSAALKENNEQLLKTVRAENKQASETAKREKLTAAAKAKGLTDEQIAATPVDVLETLVKPVVKTGNFVGAGGAGLPEPTDDEIEAAAKTYVEQPDPYDLDAIKAADKRFRQAPGRA